MTMPAHFESLVDPSEPAIAEPRRESRILRVWLSLIDLRKSQARAYLRAHCHPLDGLPDPSER